MQRVYKLLQNPPQAFKDLCNPDARGPDAKRFMQFARQLNSFFAFGSIIGNYKEAPGRGLKPVIMVRELESFVGQTTDECRL
jgi:hypothetical protein